ncbi:phosphoglycerate mutase-like protein [Trichoderma velutinum]
MATIHILRHGQSLHNVHRGYPHRDPPLTEVGSQQASNVRLPAEPDLIIVSPMTRTIQTALLVFDQHLNNSSTNVELQVWPDLRETHDEAICNKGVSRAEIATKFAQFDFSACHEEWDYPPHSSEDAVVRAESVRRRLKDLSRSYKNIFLLTHRGFIAFLVKGERFNVCECRSYRLAAEDEVNDQRHGVNCDTGKKQDFGPSLLLPIMLPSSDNENCDEERSET